MGLIDLTNPKFVHGPGELVTTSIRNPGREQRQSAGLISAGTSPAQ
jgi:hypothetical protein